MKVSGFTFIRNAVKLDYPIVEAIKSILPICDEVIVAVGKSEDESLALIEGIGSEKVKIVQTVWDDSLRAGGKVLADETNKAFAAISKDADWAFYIQGDEVLHEKYLPEVKHAMEAYLNNKAIDGLLFNYVHFYGSYDYIGSSSKWYRHEIRVIRNDQSIYSFRDAQGFRKGANQKLNVKPIDAAIYHYGWVKEPEAMQRKQESFHRLWHDDQWMEKNVQKVAAFDYLSHINQLQLFEGSHPKVMQARINAKNWQFEYDISFNKRSIKEHFKTFLRKYLNIDIGYKNFKKL